jgi:hypothetical protein
MVTPRMGQNPPEGQVWAGDNGRYASPHEYSDEKYLAWLTKMEPHRERCLFVTAPDVWGDAVATMALSLPMLPVIRSAGWPVALVAQDGLENQHVPWEDFDALFIGGSDRWRHSDGLRALVAEARRRGKWVHMGRVNSLRRMQYAESIGCDSADGTKLKYQTVDVAAWGAHVRANPSIWRPR